ncbi:MAG TPA: type IV secretion system protein [Solirubrobacteraceae bacterium]|jgi:hypothetical protein|nr:type IV secretion system protein [Solirubrobacteraceae bacterium]
MKTKTLRALKWVARPRRLILAFALAVGLVLLAHPGALAEDVFGNIGPAPQLPPGGWVGRYPVERYSLDQYFSAISVGFTSGVDTSGVAPMIAYFGAQVLWLITCFLANGVILLFALAFNLNLLTGNGTPGSGALTPVSQAIHSLYTNTFGTPWLIAMVILVGCWAMWKALVQRRYTETAGALAVSFLYFILAVGIVTQPERTIGPASKLSNELSTSLLSLTNEGGVGSEAKAKTGASNQLFELLVLNPWTVLEFGGIEHCAKVSHGKAHSVAVRPLSSDPARDTQLASQLQNGTEVQAEGKTCINDRNKYATHFLEAPFQSHDRNSEHEALENGDEEDLPHTDPAKAAGTYPLGVADEPAAEAMGKGGQYERLLLAIVILVGEVGAYLLLGALSLGVILAQILLLTLLAFAPVALLIGIFPGRGHDFFRNWLGKLASYLARKVVYSLILAVVLAVCQALDDATGNLGWLLAFALQAAFLWTAFLQRDRLAADLMAGTLGPCAAREGGNRLASLYYATRLARMMPAPHIPRRSSSQAPPNSSSSGSSGPNGESPSGSEGPEGGTPPPGGGAPGGGGGEGKAPSYGGGAPSGEESPAAPEPGAARPAHHETPTHGPGAPPPGGASLDAEDRSGDAHASTIERPPAGGAPPSSPHSTSLPPRGSEHEKDLEPDPQPAMAPNASREAQREAKQEERDAGIAQAKPAATEATSTTPPAIGQQPPSIATTPMPTASRRALDPPGPPSAPAAPPQPSQPAGATEPIAVPAPSPPRGEDEALTPSVAPGAAEPVAVLLRARQANASSNPATQEDELA